MDEIEVRVLLNALDYTHKILICMRLETDRCQLGGHLVSAHKIAIQLDAPLPVEAVLMSNGRLTCIGDTLLIKNPRGIEIGRHEVAGIDLSHTNLLTDVHRSSCVAEAHDDPADNWALILSSGPIWCFHFA
jgi:hypothetical protein